MKTSPGRIDPSPIAGLGGRRRHRGAIALVAVAGVLLLGAGALIASHPPAAGEEPTKPSAPAVRAARLDPDTEGRIDRWLLAMPARFKEAFVDTQARLIARAPADVTFHVLHADARGKRLLQARVRSLAPEAGRRIRWHDARGSVSSWVRDYFLVGRAEGGGSVAWLHHADHYRGAPGPRESQDPMPLVRALGELEPRRTSARIEGGCIVSDAETIFASRQAALAAMRGGPATSLEAYGQALRTAWGRPVVWIDTAVAAPNGHCDVLLMPVGNKRIVLADPALGARLLQAEGRAAKARYVECLRATRPDGPSDAPPPFDFANVMAELVQDSVQPARLRALRGIESQLTTLGYEVHRAPFLAIDPARYGLYVTITYANVVMDVRDGRRQVFLPTYGLPRLDEAAARTWRKLGYEVVPIPAAGPGFFGGAVRCLSQVVRR